MDEVNQSVYRISWKLYIHKAKCMLGTCIFSFENECSLHLFDHSLHWLLRLWNGQKKKAQDRMGNAVYEKKSSHHDRVRHAVAEGCRKRHGRTSKWLAHMLTTGKWAVKGKACAAIQQDVNYSYPLVRALKTIKDDSKTINGLRGWIYGHYAMIENAIDKYWSCRGT